MSNDTVGCSRVKKRVASKELELMARKRTWEGEHEPDRFLDVRFAVTPAGTNTHCLYEERSDSGVNLDFHFQVPFSVRYAVGTQHFFRAGNNLSSRAQVCERHSMTKKLLLKLQYFVYRSCEATLATPSGCPA